MNETPDLTPTPVPCEVLRAAVVVALDVVTVTLGEPVQDQGVGPGLRSGSIELTVVEVVKGRVSASAGDHVTVAVAVRSNADLWGMARAGDRYVAYCDGGSTDLAVLLTPDHCSELADDRDGSVLDDVRLVRALQRRHLTADRLLGEAELRRATAGPSFARYVWVAAREALRTRERTFERLMAVAEDPDTRVDAQEAYLLAAYEDLTFTGAFAVSARVRLVRAMVRSALDPRLGDLRSRLLGVYVPNLVRAPLPEPLRPDEVFGPGAAARPGTPAEAAETDSPTEAPAADLLPALREELEDPRDPATISPALLAWLDTGTATGPGAAPVLGRGS
jgi:hypothetical protein